MSSSANKGELSRREANEMTEGGGEQTALRKQENDAPLASRTIRHTKCGGFSWSYTPVVPTFAPPTGCRTIFSPTCMQHSKQHGI